MSVHKSPNRTLEKARRLLADGAGEDSGAGGAAGPSSGKLPVGEAPAGAASVKVDFPTVSAAAERDKGPEGGIGKTGAEAGQAKAPEGTHQPTDAGLRSGALEGKALKQNIVQRGGEGQVAAVAREGLQAQAAEAAKRLGHAVAGAGLATDLSRAIDKGGDFEVGVGMAWALAGDIEKDWRHFASLKSRLPDSKKPAEAGWHSA